KGDSVPGSLSTGLRLGGRLDRYVAELFIGSYAVAILLVVGIFLIVDMTGNLDEYMRPGKNGKAPGAMEVVTLYCLQVPFLFLQVAPFVTLVGGLFTVSKLMASREVIAALSAGISARRVLLPVFLCAAVLGAGMFGVRELAIESIGERRDHTVDRLTNRREVPVYENLWVKDTAGNPIRINSFFPAQGKQPARIEGFGATLHQGDDWVEVSARGATYEDGAWQLEEGKRFSIYAKSGSETEAVASLEAGLSPRDIRTAWKARESPTDLSFGELQELIQRDPDNIQWQTLLQVNLAFPFAHIVLLLVGLPFLLRYERSKGAAGAGMGFVLCIFYFGMDFVCRALGLQGELGPMIAGWLPILLFGSLGVVIFSSSRT
ncbi:MAG: lipopolysaccharide export system permease protein, partial [Bacteroidia bacterium]